MNFLIQNRYKSQLDLIMDIFDDINAFMNFSDDVHYQTIMWQWINNICR